MEVIVSPVGTTETVWLAVDVLRLLIINILLYKQQDNWLGILGKVIVIEAVILHILTLGVDAVKVVELAINVLFDVYKLPHVFGGAGHGGGQAGGQGGGYWLHGFG